MRWVDFHRKRVWIVMIVFNILLFSVLPAAGLAQETVLANNEAVQKSVTLGQEWMLGNQGQDGTWGADFAEKMRNTSEIAEYLMKHQPDGEAIPKAGEWLGNQETPNFDFMARTLLFKSESLGQEQMKTLLDSQNNDGGWGLAESYASDVFDTALVLNALLKKTQDPLDARIETGISYLLTQQKENGSWSFHSRQEDSVFVTAQIILLLNNYIVKTGETANELLSSLKDAGDYLLTAQQEDQTWGTEGTPLQRTLLAYQAILQTTGMAPVETVHDQLIQLQGEDGSWEENPYTTLLALQALYSYQEAAGVAISNIELYKVNGTENVLSEQFSAYETIEVKPIYEETDKEVHVLAFIKTPEGTYETVKAEENLRWETKNHQPGDYSVIVQMKDKQTGKIIASSQKTFTIVPAFKVESASILLSPENTSVGQVKEVNVQLSLFHSSNIEGEVRQKVEITNAAGGMVASQEKTIATTSSQPVMNTNMLTFRPEVGEVTTYTIKGYVYQGDQLAAETEKKFQVMPPPPPTRVEAEQALTKDSVTPGSDTVNAEFLLKGLGAPTEPERAPLDIVFVLDTSGSMSGSVTQTKEATKKLMELIQPEDRGAVVFFDSWASVIQNFTPDVSLLKKAADRAYAWGGTSIHSGISTARNLFKNQSNDEREKVIFLLSDGQSSRTSALREAGYAANEGITIHSIGLGYGVDQYLLEQIALNTKGSYRFSPTTEELEEMINEIGGEIFNLAGKDVVLSTTLPSHLTVDTNQTNPAPAIIETNADGTKTVQWKYDIIVMNQIQPITLAVKGSSFQPGENAEITTATKLTYTAKNGEEKEVLLPNMSVKVVDSYETKIALNESTFAANEDVQIKVQVTNHTDQPAGLTATVEIVDHQGEVVAEVGTYPIENLEANGVNLQEWLWNTGETYIGDYAVKVTLKDEGMKVSETSTGFTITAEDVITITTTTSQAEYQPGDEVNISHRVENPAVNKNYPNLLIKTSIVNEDNQLQFEQEHELPHLSAQQSVDRSLVWNSGQLSPGTYTVQSEVWEGEILLSSDETVFTILSSAVTGYGMEGELEITETKVVSGKPVDLAFSVKNSGNSKIENASVEVLIVDPITEKVVKSFEEAVNLPVNDIVSDRFSYNTKGLAIDSYLVVLRAVLPNGQVISLDTAAFTVDISIELEKQIKEGSRILVWTEQHKANPWIDQMVKEKSDYYHVVDNEQDFMKELRSNQYNVYLVTDTKQPLTGHHDQELLAKIHAGHRLIVTKNANLANFQTFDAFGAKLNGTQNLKDSELSSDVFADWTGTFTGKTQKYDLTSGQVWVIFSGKNAVPAVIGNQYGRGTAVHIGFDIRELAGMNPDDFIGSIMDKIKPEKEPVEPGDAQLIQLKVKANGGPIDIQLNEQIPEGFMVLDPIDFEVQGSKLTWRKVMESEEEVVLRYLAAVPSKSGNYSLVTENGTWDEGEYFSFESKKLSLEIVQSEELLLLEAIDALESSSANRGGKLADTLRGYLTDSPQSVEELETAIDEIIHVLKSLSKDKEEDLIRWRLEKVLDLYQSRWYLGGREA
nr:VWA domain-containing protein [Neobacillus sp. Marseille-Q6967]